MVLLPPLVLAISQPALWAQRIQEATGSRQVDRNVVADADARFDWFTYQGRDPVYNRLQPNGESYLNPILPGFYPDPSVTRVGADYYLVTSSFGYFPGIPIFHSRDLVRWRQLGSVLDRPSQLKLDGLGISRGVFAPAITHRDGVFYVITTLVDAGGNMLVTATNPAGPWSDPVWLDFDGIDPSLFFDDDGHAYIINNGPPEGTPLYDGHRALWMQEYDVAAKKMVGPRRLVVNGGVDINRKPIWIEGPHILKVSGTYYLIAAEGGTAEEHSEVVFRGASVWGPWEPYARNPILTQRHLPADRPSPITSTGHASFVQTPNGEWWAVFLGVRPYQTNHFNTGRETFLLPVHWRDGWPHILGGNATVPYALRRPNLPRQVAAAAMKTGNFIERDDFSDHTLKPYWSFIRTVRETWFDLTSRPGWLTLQARPAHIGRREQPSFVGRRQQHAFATVTTALRYSPTRDGDRAGLAAFHSDDFYYLLVVTRSQGRTVIQLEKSGGANSPGVTQVLASAPLRGAPGSVLYLKIDARGASYDFAYAHEPDRWITLQRAVDGTHLSTKTAGSFVGTMFGMYAYAEPSSEAAQMPSDVARSGGSAQRAPAPALLRLPRLFQDGMVLQRDVRVPVWGWANAGTIVQVTLASNTARAVTDTSGAWRVELPALRAGGPHVLTVSADSASLILRDVLIGDVWIASGQSNMEWPLSAATGGEAAIANAHDPQLREFAVPHSWAELPQDDLEGGSWLSADPQRAGRFSAVGYFFARELRRTIGVPIGIIHTSWGGSAIETWLSKESLGMSDNEWTALLRNERERETAFRDTLRARIGDLPSTDLGLVAGRAVWADPQLDDTQWTTITVPSLWEQAGYAGLDGSAWYRTTFALSDAAANQGIRLGLGRIDDDDITWVNGIEVGRTQGYSVLRTYDVPPSALRAGSNVLAVRVNDGGGGGGLYGDTAQFYIDVNGTRRPLAAPWRFKVGAVSFRADGQRVNKVPTVLYNRMVYPLQNYPIKGVIWYQGESNANNDAQARAYRAQFAQLINGWRREWRGAQADFPFLWVQLPNFGTADRLPPATAAWAHLRESQAAALSLPNTGQVVAIDVGDPGDIHPRDKEPVGTRLAAVAQRIAYGATVLASGPTYRQHTVRGNTVIVEFSDVGGGLVSRSGEAVRGFAIAAADRNWVWADAHIEDGRVIVSSPRVPIPIAVRYAWSNSPDQPSLFNREGWPAAPFRTDNW